MVGLIRFKDFTLGIYRGKENEKETENQKTYSADSCGNNGIVHGGLRGKEYGREASL